ncbi:hypothetical protein [Zhihengliuella halotolerans]|uniref:hypothetical protein n=1 Tax=Zhihengliuella halotolerans TaxID=370736 RepID=UPI000C7FAF19|nr:hypothetical protein [Zhihengliuella halotolerans]
MSRLQDQLVAGRTARARPGVQVAPSIMRGHVATVEAGRVYVTLPGVSAREVLGPVTVARDLVLAEGDRVIVAAVGASWDDLVVLAAL